MQRGLAAQLMASTWLRVVPIANDNVIVIRNITFQANKANQFIFFFFIIGISLVVRHINCLVRLQTLTFSNARNIFVHTLYQLNPKWLIHGYQATTSDLQQCIARSCQKGPVFAYLSTSLKTEGVTTPHRRFNLASAYANCKLRFKKNLISNLI